MKDKQFKKWLDSQDYSGFSLTYNQKTELQKRFAQAYKLGKREQIRQFFKRFRVDRFIGQLKCWRMV